MRKPIAGFWWSPTVKGISALAVTAAFFALGALVGGLLAFRSTESGADALQAYLDQFLCLAQEGGLDPPNLLPFLWHTLRWPLAAVLLSFSAFGLLGIPILSGLRGFFLAFSTAGFARVYGRSGLMIAFLLLGIPAFVAVPAFLLLSVQSFMAACVLAVRNSGQGKRELPYGREYFFRCGMCVAALLVSLLLERYLVPVWVSDWAKVMLR